MKLILIVIFCVVFTLKTVLSHEDIERDELTLRDQLFANVFLVKEGVDRLQISVEILNQRYSSQMEILKSLRNRFLISPDPEEEDSVCDKITGMFNATFRKYNIFESRMLTKLEEIQDDQTSRFDEISSKQRLNKNCAFNGESSATLSRLSETLTELSEKVNKFENQFTKLKALETKLDLQQRTFEEFAVNQMKSLNQINDKLSTNQAQFEKFAQELATLGELKNNINKVISNPRPKLPMEVILGLSSANITSFK